MILPVSCTCYWVVSYYLIISLSLWRWFDRYISILTEYLEAKTDRFYPLRISVECADTTIPIPLSTIVMSCDMVAGCSIASDVIEYDGWVWLQLISLSYIYYAQWRNGRYESPQIKELLDIDIYWIHKDKDGSHALMSCLVLYFKFFMSWFHIASKIGFYYSMSYFATDYCYYRRYHLKFFRRSNLYEWLLWDELEIINWESVSVRNLHVLTFQSDQSLEYSVVIIAQTKGAWNIEWNADLRLTSQVQTLDLIPEKRPWIWFQKKGTWIWFRILVRHNACFRLRYHVTKSAKSWSPLYSLNEFCHKYTTPYTTPQTQMNFLVCYTAIIFYRFENAEVVNSISHSLHLTSITAMLISPLETIRLDQIIITIRCHCWCISTLCYQNRINVRNAEWKEVWARLKSPFPTWIRVHPQTFHSVLVKLRTKSNQTGEIRVRLCVYLILCGKRMRCLYLWQSSCTVCELCCIL